MTPHDPAAAARMVQHWEAVNRSTIRRDRWRDARGWVVAGAVIALAVVIVGVMV